VLAGLGRSRIDVFKAVIAHDGVLLRVPMLREEVR